MRASDILALAAVVASIFTAGYSYRLSRQAHHVSTYYGAIDLFREIDRVFIDYPELRTYFYDGKPVLPDDPHGARARAIAELVFDVFEWTWHRQRRLNAEDKGGWQAYIEQTLRSSPVLREHYRASAAWYPVLTRFIHDYDVPMIDPAP